MKNTKVTIPCRTIRAMAWEMGKPQYWNCVLVLFFCTIVASAPGFIVSCFTSSQIVNDVASVAGIILSVILNLGTATYYIAVFRGEKGTADHITSAFDNSEKAIGTVMLVYLKVFLKGLLLIVPGIIEAFRDAFALHILSDHPEYNAVECVMASRYITEGNKGKLFKLTLSFIGWAALAALPGVIHAYFYGPVFDFAAAVQMSPEAYREALIAYRQAMFAYQSEMVPLLLSGISMLVRAYVLLSEAAFYDLASGNLLVRCEEDTPTGPARPEATLADYEIEDIFDTDDND